MTQKQPVFPVPFAAVILAAGKGTRMRSSRPKVLHKMAGEPLIQHVLRACVGAGANRAYVVLGHGREEVRAELEAQALSFQEVWQKDQLGTGHAVREAAAAFEKDDETIVIMNGDGPLVRAETIQKMIAFHREKKADLTLGVIHLEKPTGYGRVVAAKGLIKKIVEEKEASPAEKKIKLVNGGLYVVNRKFLDSFLPKLTASKKTGEIYLTDLLGLGAKQKKRLFAFEADAEELLGVNDLKELASAGKAYRVRMATEWALKGVEIADLDSVYMEPKVEVAEGAGLEPNVHLRGNTRIGAGAKIGTGSVLVNTVIEEGVEILPNCHLEDCVVKKGAHVGPFARLRPGAEIGEAAKIGNFVEVKKSRIGKGAKANHLAYIGDAEIGDGVNLGCGFITCNYDGVNKHKTVIEENVFVGSDVQVVAPVTIAKNSYVAAGSTITRDVPSGSLAIARTKQENREGYADRIRGRNFAASNAKKKD